MATNKKYKVLWKNDELNKSLEIYLNHLELDKKYNGNSATSR